jgi:hypothetical protein
MNNREALNALACGAVIRAQDGVPLYHHPTKGFMHRIFVGERVQWVQFGANLAAAHYELVLDVARPA